MGLQQIKDEARSEKFKTMLGGYCWAQDGGSGGYEYEDIIVFIDSLITQAYKEGEKEVIYKNE